MTHPISFMFKPLMPIIALALLFLAGCKEAPPLLEADPNTVSKPAGETQKEAIQRLYLPLPDAPSPLRRVTVLHLKRMVAGWTAPSKPMQSGRFSPTDEKTVQRLLEGNIQHVLLLSPPRGPKDASLMALYRLPDTTPSWSRIVSAVDQETLKKGVDEGVKELQKVLSFKHLILVAPEMTFPDGAAALDDHGVVLEEPSHLVVLDPAVEVLEQVAAAPTRSLPIPEIPEPDGESAPVAPSEQAVLAEMLSEMQSTFDQARDTAPTPEPRRLQQPIKRSPPASGVTHSYIVQVGAYAKESVAA
ncbi:MAG: hypothetical protein HQL53_09520, partial [Magnetococcales bacterium]|nr:hypothetical protein [Magnetococcales bacterium]